MIRVVVGVLVSAAIVFGHFALYGSAAPPNVCPPGRKVVLLHGLGSIGTSDELNFVSARLQGCETLTLSYGDTYEGPPGHKARNARGSSSQLPDAEPALFLSKLLAAHPGAEFDLIGYSLGGFHAAYWASVMATPDELARIHSVTTIDSPLRGRPLITESEKFLLDAIPLGPASVIPIWLDPSGETVSRLGQRAGAAKVNIVTIRSRDDRVVPFEYATLSEVWQDVQLGSGFGDCGWGPRVGAWWWLPWSDRGHCSLESHNAVLQDPKTQQAVMSAIQEEFPGYVDRGLRTSSKGIAKGALLRSADAMRRASRFTFTGTGSVLWNQVAAEGSVSQPQGFAAKGVAPFVGSWDVRGDALDLRYTVGGRSNSLRLPVPAGQWLMTELSALLVSVEGWSAVANGDSVSLWSAVPTHVWRQAAETAGIEASRVRGAAINVELDPVGRWKQLALTFDYELLAFSILGQRPALSVPASFAISVAY